MRFLFHTYTVLVIHAGVIYAIAWFETSGFTHLSIKASLPSGDMPWQEEIIFYLFAGYLVLGLAAVLWRITKRIHVVVALMITLIVAAWCWYPVWTRIGDISTAVGLLTMLIRLEFAAGLSIVAAVTVVGYLISSNPDPLVPNIRSVPDALHVARKFIVSRDGVAWGLLILILIQTAGIIILWTRLSFVERKLGGLTAVACDETRILPEVKKATVRIAGENGEGTGMIVREDGLVLTNAHVVEQEVSPKVIMPDYSMRTSEVVLLETEADVALLRLEKGIYPTVALGESKSLRQFVPLYIVGYPLGTELRGDATIATGRYITTRSMRGTPVDYLQYDGAINPGNSGGPVVSACGDVVGMTTSGTPGLGLAINTESIRKFIDWVVESPDVPDRVNEPDLNPDRSAKDAVTAFYMNVKQRKFDKAYALLSTERTKDVPFDVWIRGYKETLDVSLVSVADITNKPGHIYVKIRSLDLVGEDIVDKYFEGEWEVIDEKNSLRLRESNMKEIKDPSWIWFWNEER